MRHPDCQHTPDECRITVDVAKEKGKDVHDGYGRVVKAASTHESYECDTCGLEWDVDDGKVGEAKHKAKPKAAAAPAPQAQSQSQATTKHA